MILGVTGHRPQKLGDFAFRTRAEVTRAIEVFAPERLLTGMALGVDTWAAETCIGLGIPFVAVIPHDGQERRWSRQQQDHYWQLLNAAERTFYPAPGPYAPWKFQKRNEVIVDNCEWLLAVYDGTPGGTKNCVDYALKVNRSMTVIDPRKLT